MEDKDVSIWDKTGWLRELKHAEVLIHPQLGKLATKAGTSSGEEAHRGRDGSRISEACSESSESSSSDDTRRPFSGEDCAGLVLACLHCRFHEFTRLLLDAFARAVGHDFPSVDRVTESGERDRQEWEHWPFDLGLDWDFCSSCQDSAELLELAMEISEMCYR